MQKKLTDFRRFWVKDPNHSENMSDEKCYLYRSTSLSFRASLWGYGALHARSSKKNEAPAATTVICVDSRGPGGPHPGRCCSRTCISRPPRPCDAPAPRDTNSTTFCSNGSCPRSARPTSQTPYREAITCLRFAGVPGRYCPRSRLSWVSIPE